jgi:hypothetical protein
MHTCSFISGWCSVASSEYFAHCCHVLCLRCPFVSRRQASDHSFRLEGNQTAWFSFVDRSFCPQGKQGFKWKHVIYRCLVRGPWIRILLFFFVPCLIGWLELLILAGAAGPKLTCRPRALLAGRPRRTKKNDKNIAFSLALWQIKAW